jgi:phospho-N-acetylmuramoyl-pentapeptide-transferase
MIYNLLLPYCNQYHLANLFHYVSFRSFLAFLLPFIVWCIYGDKFIAKMRILQKFGQPIRDLGPKSHMTKIGTPTMGGLFIIFLITISTLLFADLKNIYIWCSITIILGFGLIGAADDYTKIKFNNHNGLTVKQKLAIQIILSVLIGAIICYSIPSGYSLLFPFIKNFSLNLGYFYLIFTTFVIIGSSNAVNLTDGLDGLASLLLFIAFGCFAIICYLAGNIFYSKYLLIQHIIGASELTILCAATMGSLLGFLWYNSQPASIFMGDTGSLALGALLGCVSIIVKQEITLAIIGGVFVIETLSVLMQVYYFKYTKGRRIFKMAPLHHHFEQCGWPESKVVIRFTIVAIILAIIGLLSLKIR